MKPEYESRVIKNLLIKKGVITEEEYNRVLYEEWITEDQY